MSKEQKEQRLVLFEIGDVVHLNSGGPNLTVEDPDIFNGEEDQPVILSVSYFDENKFVTLSPLPQEMFHIAEEEE